jgi:hypothetical protein
VPSAATSREAIEEALEGVVLPGLQALGVDVKAAQQWTATALHG